MANTQPTDYSKTSIYTKGYYNLAVDYNIEDPSSMHKKANSGLNSIKYNTLDFSSVGLYNDGKNASSSDVTAMRRWHQLTLYIKGEVYQNNEPHTNYIIASNLPEQFGYTLSSEYSTPLGGTGVSELANALSQGFFGTSTYLRANSVRVWSKTTNLTLDLTIPVLDDGWVGNNSNGFGTNFMQALEVLASCCLPTMLDNSQPGGEGTQNKASDQGNGSIGSSLKETAKSWTKKYAYQPPMSPLILEGGKGEGNKLEARYGKIVVQLGGTLLVDNCVLENVSVNYPDTKAMIRHNYAGNVKLVEDRKNISSFDYLTPVVAELKLKLSTVVGLTRESFSNMLWLSSNDNNNATFNTTTD